MQEAPTNIPGDGPWILRLTDSYGRNLLCRLPNGSYRIGSALDCDIVLIDDQLDCAHILALREGRISIKTGRNTAKDAQDTDVAAGPDAHDSTKPPEPEAAGKDTKDADRDGPDVDTVANDKPAAATSVGSKISPDGKSASITADDYEITIRLDESYVVVPERKTSKTGVAPVLRRAASLAASVVVIGLLGSLILTNFLGHEGVATEPDKSYPAINSLVHELGLQPVAPITVTSSGAWRLQQALWLPGEKDRLLVRARQTGLALKLEGPEYERLQQSLVSLGHGHGVELTIRAAGRALEVSGLVKDEKVRDQLLATIARDMPDQNYLLPPRLLTVEEAALLLSASLRVGDQTNTISVVPQDGQVWILKRNRPLPPEGQRTLSLFRQQYGETAISVKDIGEMFAEKETFNIWQNKLRYAFVAEDRVVIQAVDQNASKRENHSEPLDLALDLSEARHDR